MKLKFYPKTKLKLAALRNLFVVSLITVLSIGHSYAQTPATALSFDGVDDYVKVASSPSLNISSAITLEAWVFATQAVGVQDIICKSSNATNTGYIFPRTSDAWDDVEFLLYINGQGWQTLSVPYGESKINQWHHLAATYDGFFMRIYIDGVLKGSKSIAGTIATNNNPLVIGGQTGFSDEYFQGTLDDIKIWNRALTQCEITNNMHCELGGTQTGLAAYYKLNQGFLGILNTLLGTDVTDASGNNNNGTLMNFLLLGTLSNWASGNVSGTCSVFAPVTAVAGSLQAILPIGSDIHLTSSGGTTYSWVGPNGFTSNQQNPVITGAGLNATGTYTVTVTNGGCSATASTSITIANFAGALNFDGTTNVTIPNSTSLNPNAFTIETWINPSNVTSLTNTQSVISKSNAINNTGYIFPRTDDGWHSFSFWLTINGQWKVVSASYPGLNNWNHVAATYDGFTMKIYMNGNLQGSLAVTGTVGVNNNDLTLGQQAGIANEFFKGSLDETRIWSRALTQCEIQNNLSCQLNGANNGLASQTGLAAYYRYNQGLQNVNNSSINTLADSSVNHNNGTLNGFQLTGTSSNWIAGNVSSTCSVFQGTQASAGSNGPTLLVGSTINLTASSGNSWSWTGPNNFTSTLQNPSISNAGINATGAYTVSITGNGCTTTAGVNVTVAFKGGALNFDGNNDNVIVPNSPSLNISKTITLESWIYPTSGTNLVQDVMSKSTLSVNNGYIFPRTDDGWKTFVFYLHVNGSFQRLTAPYPALNEWHHVAATYDGFFMRLYLDGILVASKEMAGDITVNSNDLVLGSQPGFGEFYTGLAEESRIWGRALNQCEIINNMNCELDPAQKNALVAYYKYNQGFANVDNPGLTTLTDASDNGNNGTLTNFALGGSTSNWTLSKGNDGTCLIFTQPPVTASANASVFGIGSTIQLFATGGPSYTWDGPNSFASSNPNPSIPNAQINQSGTYTVTAHFVKCDVKASTRLAVSPLSVITASGPTTFCPSTFNTLSIANTGTAYQWYLNGVAIAGANSRTYAATLSGDYTVSVTSGNDILLSAPITLTVVDNLPPQPDIATLPVLNAVTGVAITTFPTATDNCKGVIHGTTNNPLTYNLPGTYTISWTYDDQNGNVIHQNQQVLVIDNIPPVLTVPANMTLNASVVTCGAIANFTATATDNTGTPVTIAYSQNPGTLFATGNTTVTVTATDASNNVTTQTFTVTVLPTVVAPITGNTTICTGLTTALNTTTSTGGIWSSDNTNVATVDAQGIVTAVSNGTAVITYTNNCGVSASATVTVTARPATPVVNVVDGCGTSVLTASGITGNVLWSNTATTPSISVSVAGNYSVTQSVNGCTSLPASATATPAVTPATPVVTVANNCGTSTLSTNATGNLLWSNNATSSSITVSNAATYTVTQTLNGCTSVAGSGASAPNATPATPVVTVVDNCGTSTLSTNAAGNLLWSNNATTASITVSNAATYSVTQTVNGCVSAAGSGTSAPKAVPSAPVVTVSNSCGTSTLSTNAAGSLLWSNNATTASITVSNAATYTVTQTVNGCVSAAGSGTSAPTVVPSAPVVTVANNCGTSTLSTNATGSLLWSNNATSSSITVSNAATYTVTQTVNGCTSAAGSGTSAPNATPAAPVVTVVDNCGTSTLSTNASGNLLWSNNATSSSITVSNAATYTVTQTVNGCVSAAGSGTSAPKAVPSAPVVTVSNSCGTSTLSTNAAGSLLWSNNATSSSITVSNAATYTVTQTVNGCVSAAGSGTSAPTVVPSAPVVTVANNCGTSTLSTNATGSLLWSNNATSSSITVSNAATYTVTQTVNGCTSAAGSGTSAPKAVQATPVITVVNNCGSTTLSTNATGNLVWSNNATTSSITINTAGNYSVTATNVAGCFATSAVTAATINTAPVVSAITGSTAVNIGATTQLADATTGGTWSSNSANATVNASGIVTGVSGGTATISYTVTGGNSCATTVTTVVTVNACTSPVLTTATANITANTGSQCNAQVAYTINISSTPAAAYSYTFTGATTGSGSGTGSGSVFTTGVTTVKVTATNACGSASSSFTITVKDATAPVPTVTNLPVITGECSATAGSAKPTANDNCSGIITGTTTDPLTYTTQGTYYIRWTYKDAAGNSTVQTQTVIVKDDIAPVPSIATLATITGQCSASLSVNTNNTGGCSDDCRCCRDVCHCRTNSCTCRSNDYNWRDIISYLFSYYYGGQYNGSGDYDDDDDDHDCDHDDNSVSAPTAVDNCKGTITGTTTDPLSYSSQGTYTIHWKFDDGNGNVTIQNQTVIVKDNTAPVPNTTSLPSVSGNCAVTVTRPTASDNCAGTITATTTDPLTYTNPGTYTVHWTYNDGNGNTATQTQTVTVKDAIAPVPTVSNLPTINGDCSVTITSAPTAKDNCDGTVIATTTDPLTYTVKGSYTIHWSYSDGKNVTTQNQTVVVKDATAPVISDPADVTVSCSGSTAPSVTGTATATDNCSAVTITYSDAVNGNTITRTWKATDASGNYSTSTQRITQGSSFTASVTSVPTSSTYTGGISTNLYLGYGAQSTTLQMCSLPSSGAPYTYAWTGSYTNKLNNTNSASPVFTPTSYGSYTFSVTVTNKYGCTSTTAISICVTDIRVAGTSGGNAKVYLCHTPSGYHPTPQTLQVLVNQVASHIGNNTCGSNGSDRLGSCDQSPCNSTGANSIVTNTAGIAKDGVDKVATTEEELKITVMPNPSTTFFTLKLESKYETPVSMRVMDANGRVVDAKSRIGANSTIQVGANYASGTYYAELIQGATRKVVQLIKVRG